MRKSPSCCIALRGQTTMASVLQGMRNAAAAGVNVWSTQGSKFMSSLSVNRLPLQITPTTVLPISLQILAQHTFPLGRRATTVVTTLPTPAPTKPTVVVGNPVEVEGFDCLNRNARRGKKANHGKRPVSSARRKQKNRTFGRKNG
ncbi:hypothetical protein VYU27_000869 [Nannochloropsis oceanica]